MMVEMHGEMVHHLLAVAAVLEQLVHQ